MSEQSLFSTPAEQPREPTAAAPTLPQVATVGQQLRAAREARNLSVADAAQSLKLGPKQVVALESEDWSSLPGNTMIRGFVRNYARLLNLDADALMRGLDAEQMQRTLHLHVSAGTSASLPQTGNRAERRDYLAIIGGLLLLALAVLAYMYIAPGFWEEQLAALTGSSSQQASGEAAAPTVADATAPTAAAVDSPPATATASALAVAAANPAGSASQTPSARTEVAAAAASPAKPAAKPEVKLEAAAANGLKLRFAQPSWIEVIDARGQVVATGFKPADSQLEITGEPPFSLVLGNARYVTAEYQGKTIDLEPHTSKGVARLTVK
ncbi:RodZ domain-containing protein [Candidatus Accumulibacter sp. ACC003]|uniref:helix-turn-helix domain-containing protein n=1 Tax=Candidatus Accumulibacter sp. ACC003 TaxID=2823334 RepID=UPI0025C7296A|nr:RodZ domain-containing protein [Candidatus Accumulibacter sp. ACC003]